MHRLRQGLQPVLEPHHPLPETHRVQALRLRPLRPRFPAQGGPPPPQGDATHRVATHSHIVPERRKRRPPPSGQQRSHKRPADVGIKELRRRLPPGGRGFAPWLRAGGGDSGVGTAAGYAAAPGAVGIFECLLDFLRCAVFPYHATIPKETKL